MAVDFSKSKTKENLMRAFAGESQARNRYTIAAEKAEKQGFYALKEVFLFTADQERAHAARFYELLNSQAGTTISMEGGYPVDLSENLVELLKMASHNERQEHESVYPDFAEIAEEEGFPEIAYVWRQIAEIEKIHGERFETLASMLEENQYYEQKGTGEWMCLNCGHIFTGESVPPVCPVCRHERGYFLPSHMAPYLGFFGKGE